MSTSSRRGQHFSKEHQSKAGKARGASRRAKARTASIGKIADALSQLEAIDASTTDEQLSSAVRGMLIETLHAGDRWQRIKAAELIRSWYLTDDEDKAGDFERLIDAIASRTD